MSFSKVCHIDSIGRRVLSILPMKHVGITQGLYTMRVLSVLLLAIAFASQAGCLTLSGFVQKDSPKLDTRLLEAQGYSIPPGGMPMGVSAEGSSQPSIVMEVRTGGDERHVERVPIPVDRGLFIEELVQQAELHKKLGKLQVSIMRDSEGGPPIRMDVQTDSQGRATSMGSNYALYPGDHVIVNVRRESQVQKILKQFGLK